MVLAGRSAIMTMNKNACLTKVTLKKRSRSLQAAWARRNSRIVDWVAHTRT